MELQPPPPIRSRPSNAWFFERRKKVEDNGRDAKYPCSVCVLGFPSKRKLQAHRTREHKHERQYLLARHPEARRNPNFVCDVCEEAFANRQQLYDHRRYRHSKQELTEATQRIPTWKCESCGRGHKSSEALRKHRERYHRRESKYSNRGNQLNSNDSGLAESKSPKNAHAAEGDPKSSSQFE